MSDRNYKYWEIKILYSIVFGYACYYLVRQNYSIAFSDKSLGLSTNYQYIGWAFTINSIVYGLGKIINGYLSDRLSSKIFLSLGLFISGLLSLIASFFDNIIVLSSIFIINGWFQSMGFPATAKLIVNWTPKDKIASRWSIATCSHQIGGVTIMLAGGYLLEKYGWRYVLAIPGILTIIASFILFNTIKNSSAEIGVKQMENNIDENSSSFKSLVYKLFNSRELQLLCLANMFAYAIRMGILNWAPIFLTQYHGSSSLLMGVQIGFYEAMGLIGTISIGYIIDKIFRVNVSIVGALYMLFFIIFFYLFWQIDGKNPWTSMLLMGAIGFIIYIPQIIVGIISTKISKKSDIGVINGFIGLFGYVGTAIAGIGNALIVTLYGWNGSFIFFILIGCIGLITFINLAYFEWVDLKIKKVFNINVL